MYPNELPEVTGEMMTTEELREVMDSHEELDNRVRQVRDALIDSAKDTVDETLTCRPVVAVVKGGNVEEVDYLYPHYSNNEDKAEAFARVNQHIRDTNAYGAVLSIPISWEEEDQDPLPAVMSLVRTRSWSELIIFPYHKPDDVGGEVEWLDEEGPHDNFNTALIEEIGN